LPGPLKQAARIAWQRQQMRRAMRRLVALPPGTTPERRLLDELRAAWDNEGFTADIDYLAEVARHAAQTPGPVLECGSGLTTLLLGALAGRRGVEVGALGNDPQRRRRGGGALRGPGAGPGDPGVSPPRPYRWVRRVGAALRDHVAGQVYLWLSPLSDYGAFDWYAAPLPLMPEEFRLVVCDGPPDDTRGGRFGLLSVIGDRLPPGAVILLDDAARE